MTENLGLTHISMSQDLKQEYVIVPVEIRMNLVFAKFVRGIELFDLFDLFDLLDLLEQIVETVGIVDFEIFVLVENSGYLFESLFVPVIFVTFESFVVTLFPKLFEIKIFETLVVLNLVC